MTMTQTATITDCAEISRMLADHDIKPTLQRIEIASFLFARPQHVAADQVLAEVNRIDDKVSKATVYNTLNLFVEKGLLREVLVDPERVFYDSNNSHHHHIYNEDTGEVSDLQIQAVMLKDPPNLPENLEIVGTDVVIRVRSRG